LPEILVLGAVIVGNICNSRGHFISLFGHCEWISIICFIRTANVCPDGTCETHEKDPGARWVLIETNGDGAPRTEVTGTGKYPDPAGLWVEVPNTWK
jgi:hypothetical protein